MTKCILFLCTGNYYRSRYAEELFNSRAKSQRLDWRAISRGVAETFSTDNVGPMSRFVVEALQARGVVPGLPTRHPLSCSRADLDKAHLIIALSEAEHRLVIKQRFPNMVTKVSYWHIDDIELVDPTIALPQIDGCVEELIQNLRTASACCSS